MEKENKEIADLVKKHDKRLCNDIKETINNSIQQYIGKQVILTKDNRFALLDSTDAYQKPQADFDKGLILAAAIVEAVINRYTT